MIGFQHDELGYVNLITDNLRDRYKDPFSILKELIQNADDAEAKRMRVGLVPGNADSPHSLLQGQGLVVVNDGNFLEKDYRAICSFGLNSKAADAATIGKFGLGMKSVFHLCEALCFIAKSEKQPYGVWLTPWGKTRPDWDIPEESWRDLIPRMRDEWLNAVNWGSDPKNFILYLPLRRKAQLNMADGRTVGAIIENYPGDGDEVSRLLRDEATAARLASLLPLLRDLRSIQIYAPDGDGSSGPVHSIELGPNAARPLREHEDGESELTAAITLRGRRYLSIGWQRHEFTESLRLLRQQPAWPASYVRNEHGQERREPDKAQPHAAAVFSQESAPGDLTIRWAVFLPIEERAECVRIDPRMGGYTLTLHGHFFVDAGRNGLYGLDGSGDESFAPNEEARVRRGWNRTLAEEGTLDLVFPALDRFCREAKMAEERVATVTKALGESNLWRDWRQSIAANHKWVRNVGREGCRWTLVKSERTLPLPSAPKEYPDRPWRVLPALTEVAGSAVLFDPEAQNLVAAVGELGSWEEDEVETLIRSIDVRRTFSSSVDVEYLARFLENLTVRRTERVQREFCSLLRRAVDVAGLERLRGLKERVSRVAALISPERKIRIRFDDIPLTEYLIRQPASALPWPKELDAEAEPPEPDAMDVELLLESLAVKPDSTDWCRLYAEDLLRRTSKEARRGLLDRLEKLAILSAFDCQAGERTSVSASALRGAWNRGTLFLVGLGTTDLGRAHLGPLLQGVLPEESVLVVKKDLAALVLDDAVAGDMSACDTRAVLECLGSQPRTLADVPARGKLLREIKLPDRDPETLRGMRYLLHGNPQHHDDNSELWKEQDNQQSAWRKLWKAALGPGEQWRVIDHRIATEVTDTEGKALNLRRITPEQVVKLATEKGVPQFLELDGSEYETILGFPQWGEDAWRNLPYHLAATGKRVRILEGTYLEAADLPLPPSLLDRATIIKRSKDAAIADLQLKWLHKVDRRAAIELALGDKSPEVWCKDILDWLRDCEPSNLPPTFQSVPWLRTRFGLVVSPKNFILLPEIQGDVTPIAERSKEFATPSMLDDGVRDHPAIQRLTDDGKSIDALTRMVAGDGAFAVGEVTFEDHEIEEFAKAFQSCPGPVSVSWGLVASVYRLGEVHGKCLLEKMSKPIPRDRINSILKSLAGKKGADKAFERYLALFVKPGPNSAVLGGLHLRAKSGVWRPAEELCFEVPGADRGFLLCKEHGAVLQEIVRRRWDRKTKTVSQVQTAPAVEPVRKYFDPWRRRSERIRAQVGVVITLLAGDTELKADAKSWLGSHSREWMLDQLPWRNDLTGQPLDGLSPEAAMAKCVVHFAVHDASQISCVSLIGAPLNVPLDKSVENLVVVADWVDGESVVTYDVRLRSIEISAFGDAQLSDILRATAEHLIKYIYLQPVDLHALWAKLDRTEQLHVDTAEKLILEYLPFYLGQLRPVASPGLVHKLGEIEEQRRLKVEHEGGPEAEAKSRVYETRREELRDMLRRDPEAQKAVLEAVRARLRDSQYQPSSMPFELFQNADDAYVQMREIRRVAELTKPDCNDRFVVVDNQDVLSFLHWGRPVNYIGSHGFDGRQRNYHRDLEKMLTLASSDKQDPSQASDDRVTGRFGLGFKSVLLVCDRPQVSSGDLQFEIVGGVLPNRLVGDLAGDLRKGIEDRTGGEEVSGTMVRLPGVPDEIRGDILADFRRHAGYLCAFGLSIREIHFSDHSGSQTIAWAGSIVAGIESIELGRIPSGAESMKALRVQLEDGVVLFGLGAEGLRDLPKGTPVVWATCPTREEEHFGFAISARFEVDPGRARLSANGGNNVKLARKLGAQLGERLRALRLKAWNEVRQDLGLVPEAGEYDFWNSLWTLFQRTIQNSETAVGRIMTPLLVAALGGVADKFAVVPNGLEGNARALIIGSEVRHKLTGALTVDGCSTPLFTWREWTHRGYSYRSVISAKHSQGLVGLGFGAQTSINFATIASWLDGRAVRAEDAGVLGSILQAVQSEGDRNQEIRGDLRQAETALESVQFSSEGGTTERARDLVALAARGDEPLRGAFAPDNQRLSIEYDEAAFAFFRFCRGPLGIGADKLAQWITRAEGRDARVAALKYLHDGDLAGEVQKHLRKLGINGTWLNDPSARAQLPGDLLEPLCRPFLDPSPHPGGLVASPNPRVLLERIWNWWARNHDREITRYDQQVYPEGRPPRLAKPWEEGFDRSEWLVVLTRAAFYRMGRVGDQQHRAYIELAQRKGWWEVFSAEDPQTKADKWMGVLDDFHEGQTDDGRWENWMRCFPAIYKLACQLEQYAEIFLDLEREKANYDLLSRINSWTDSGRGGGGIGVRPPSLGIGTCFVVRELVRLKHITNEHAHQHAFVPTGGVRELLDRFGLEVDNSADVRVSNQIHEQISKHLGPERATFGMTFDIPLQIVAANPELEARLLSGQGIPQGGI